MSDKRDLRFWRLQLENFSSSLDEDGAINNRISYLSRKLGENRSRRETLENILATCDTSEVEEQILAQLKRVNNYSMKYGRELIDSHSQINLIYDSHQDLTLRIL